MTEKYTKVAFFGEDKYMQKREIPCIYSRDKIAIGNRIPRKNS